MSEAAELLYTPGPIVYLAEEDAQLGIDRGWERHKIARRQGPDRTRTDRKRSGVEVDILGAQAEIVICRYVNVPVPPNNTYTGDDGYDIPWLDYRIDAKGRDQLYRKGFNHLLRANAKHNTATHYILVYRHSRHKYEIIGGVTAQGFEDRKIWLEHLPQPCWGVPFERLDTFKDLFPGPQGVTYEQKQ